MKALFIRLYLPSKYTIYLSFFRAYISLHIIFKILTWLPNSNLLFSPNGIFAVKENANFFGKSLLAESPYIFFIFFLLLAMLVLFGIGRNWTIIGLYIFTNIVQYANPYLSNGGDNLLKFVLLYLCFADSFRYCCFRNRTRPATPQENILTNLSVWSIKIHLCLIYLVSGLYKAHSKVWFSGVAAYYTLSLKRFMGTTYNTLIAKNGFLITAVTYFVMLWEIYFVLLANWKRTRTFAIVSGIFVHLGILVFMMLYEFQLLFIACYGFFYIDSDFIRLKYRLEAIKKRLRLNFLTH